MTSVDRPQCCFCGNAIVVDSVDPVELTIRITKDEEQGLYCHHRCLKKSLDASVPLFPFEGT